MTVAVVVEAAAAVDIVNSVWTGGGAVNVGKRSTASLTTADSSTMGSGSDARRMAVCGATGCELRSCVVTTIRHVSSSICKRTIPSKLISLRSFSKAQVPI